MSKNILVVGASGLVGSNILEHLEDGDSKITLLLRRRLEDKAHLKQIITELLRIGGRAVVSFPNFGHWKIRLQLLFSGKMPVTEGLPFAWYDTPNIHFFTIKDFQNLCLEMSIKIERSIGLTSKGKQFEINNNFISTNLFTSEAIFLLSYQKFEPIKIKSTKRIFAKNSAIVS